jgi:hypothetical protein
VPIGFPNAIDPTAFCFALLAVANQYRRIQLKPMIVFGSDHIEVFGDLTKQNTFVASLYQGAAFLSSISFWSGKSYPDLTTSENKFDKKKS